MDCLPLLLCLMSLLDSALASLPAPVNLSIKSVNFHHVLRWDPGPGTPPGTEYEVCRVTRFEQKERKGKKWKVKLEVESLSKTTTTSVKLVLQEPSETYNLTVRASYNQTESPESAARKFTPVTDTEIGAPTLSLAGCGNCIQVNISLPEPDRNSGVADIHSFYMTEYTIRWKKRNGEEETPLRTEEKSYTMSNLQKGEEYCVRVLPDFGVNKNAEESAWECTLTSIVGPNRGPVVFGSVAAVVILVIAGVMAAMFLLYYTGFICKLKATLPRALIAALSGGYTLTPEMTIPDQITIIPEKQRRQNNATTPRRASRHANSEDEEEDEEEEEEEGLNVYMNRPTDLSSDQSSSQDSGNASGSRTLEAEVPELEVVHEGLDADEAKAEGAAEVSFIPEETGVRECATGEEVEEEQQQEEEEEEEEVRHSSGNIDLFSITLASLAVREEEEEEEEAHTRDSLTNLLRLCQQPRAPTDSQTEVDHQTAVAVTLPAQEDFTGSGYEVKRTFSDCFKTCDGETQEEDEEDEEDEEEEEEEEDFSGYMRHT